MKNRWKKHHFYSITYIYGVVFINFTEAYSHSFSRTPPHAHGACTVPGTHRTHSCSSAVVHESPQFPEGDKWTLRRKGGKGTISHGWEWHFWYDSSLHFNKQQLLAAARIWNSKGDWRTRLILGASRIMSTERLRKGSAKSIIMNAAFQLLALHLHAHTNYIKYTKRILRYRIIRTVNFNVIASYNHVCLNTVNTEGCNP